MAAIQEKNPTRVKDLAVEKRKVNRYQLAASAIFSWQNTNQKQMQGEGVTRDISPLGAFVFTPTCPPVEATIQFEVLLPPLTEAIATTRIKGEARVLRVEAKCEGRVAGGFAVLCNGFKLGHSATDKTEAEFDNVKKLLELRRTNEIVVSPRPGAPKARLKE